MYVNQVALSPHAKNSWLTSEPKPAPVSVIVPWEVPWGKIGDTMTIEIYPHSNAIARGGIIYTYTYKASVPATFNLPPDTRSSETFDPRALKPLAGLHLDYVEGIVYVIRDRDKIQAQEGFQLREGDSIEVSGESEAHIIIVSEAGKIWGIDGIIGKRLKVAIPTKEDLIKWDQEFKKEREEIETSAGLMTQPGLVGLLIMSGDYGKSLKNWLNPEREFGIPGLKSLSVEMSYATAEDVHTSFVCLQISDASGILVLDGTVKFTSNVTGEEILVNAGEMATATATGLSPLESFDVEAEKAIWEKYISTTEGSPVILASTWTVSERGPQGDYYGTWTRRPGTDTFDASWSRGSITDVIDITSVEGNEVTLHRHGNNGDYTGTILPDGLSISGTASWYSPGEKWTATTT
jgi:hypothetical protein